MSYNGSGVFNINTAGQPVVTGTVISSTAFNALTADLATGLTTALTKDGQTTPTANIPMGGFKITGIAAATTLGDALSYGRAATVSALTSTAAISASRFISSSSTSVDTASSFGYNSIQGTYIFSNTGSSRIFSLYNGTGGEQYVINTDYSHNWYTNTANRMTLDSSGNLLVGTTAIPNVGITGEFGFSVSLSEVVISKSGADGLIIRTTSAASNNIRLYNLNNQVGSVSTTTTATAYNTSSDYRLKNTILPITGALAKVDLLKPVTYKWKFDGSDSEGFIAHELAEVCPQAVSGEKDAVDKDGKPIYQGIDTSFLVATLTASIQELNARLTALESK
jgi:hypothetical protein